MKCWVEALENQLSFSELDIQTNHSVNMQAYNIKKHSFPLKGSIPAFIGNESINPSAWHYFVIFPGYVISYQEQL